MMSLSLVASQISYFPDNAHALIHAGLLESLPSLLSYDYRHPLTPVAVQLLWNLLDFAPVATRVGVAALCMCVVCVRVCFHLDLSHTSGSAAATIYVSLCVGWTGEHACHFNARRHTQQKAVTHSNNTH